MADTASRDSNFVPTLLAVSAADGTTTTKVYANPATHRLLVDLGSGVTGPGTSTDKAIARWDGTTGLVIKDSGVTISDVGVFAGTSNVPYITSGAGAPGTTPGKIGDMYVRTSNAKVYVATGTSSSADWTILN